MGVPVAAVTALANTRIGRKIAWVREAAEAAGRPAAAVELQMNLLLCRIERSSTKSSEWVSPTR